MASPPPAPPCPLLLGGVLGSLGSRRSGHSHTLLPFSLPPRLWSTGESRHSCDPYVCSREAENSSTPKI